MTEPIETNLSIIGGSTSPQDGTNNRFYASSYPTLNAAISAIGATEGTLVIDQACSLTANTTIPTTLSMICYKTGIITASNSATLTINGPFSAGMFQCFSGFGTADVTFGQNSLKEIHPEWFGAIADGSTASGPAIQKAINSAATGHVVKFGSGTYLTSQRLVLKSWVSYNGNNAGSGGTEIKQADGANIDYAMLVSYNWENNSTTADGAIYIRDIFVNGNSANNTGATCDGIRFMTLQSQIVGCLIYDVSGYGIYLSGLNKSGGALAATANNNVIRNTRVTIAGLHGIFGDGSIADTEIDQCIIGTITQTGIYFDEGSGNKIRDNQVYGCGQNGIVVAKGGSTIIANNLVQGPGASATTGTYSGILMQSDNNSLPCSVIGNQISILDSVSVTGTTYYGIQLAINTGRTTAVVDAHSNVIRLSSDENGTGVILTGAGIGSYNITGNAVYNATANSEFKNQNSFSSVINHSGNTWDRYVFTFSVNDATPSVNGYSTFKTANTFPTTVTAFDNGNTGQRIFVLINDNNTTIDFTGTNLKGNAGSDWIPKNGDFLEATYDGTNWYCKVSEAA